MEVVKEIKPRKKKVVADAPVQVEQPNNYQDKLLELLAFKRNLDAYLGQYSVKLEVSDTLMEIGRKLDIAKGVAKSKSTYDVRNMDNEKLVRAVENRLNKEGSMMFLLSEFKTKKGSDVVFSNNVNIDKLVQLIYQNTVSKKTHLFNVFKHVTKYVGMSLERDALQAKETLLSDNSEIVEQLNNTMQGFADLPEQAKKSVLATYLVNQNKAND
jgi:hypothetical protein